MAGGDASREQDGNDTDAIPSPFASDTDELRHSLYSLRTQLDSVSREIDALFDAQDFSASESGVREVHGRDGARLQYLYDRQQALQRTWSTAVEKGTEETVTRLAKEGQGLLDPAIDNVVAPDLATRLFGPNPEETLDVALIPATYAFLEFVGMFLVCNILVYYNHINPDLPLFWRVLLSPFCGFPYGSLLGAPVVIYFARLFFSDILPPHMIPATNPSLLPNLPVLLTTIFLVAYSEIPFLLAIAKAIFGPYHEMFLHPANGFPLGSTVGVWVFTALARPLFEQALGKKADGTLAAANKAAREGLTEMLSVYIVSCATGSYFSANFPLPFVQRILLHPLLSFPYGSLLLTPTINRFARVFFPLVLPFDTVPKEDPGLFPHIPIALATYILLLVPEVPLLKSAGALVFGSYDWLILDPGNGYVIGFTVGVWISVWLARRLLIAPTFKTAERAEEPSIRVAKLSSDRATNGAGPQKRRPFEADSDQGPGEKVPLFAFPTAPSEGTQSSKSAQSKPGKSGKKGKR